MVSWAIDQLMGKGKRAREGRTGERSEPEGKVRRGGRVVFPLLDRRTLHTDRKPAGVLIPHPTRLLQRKKSPPTALSIDDLRGLYFLVV